MKMKKIFGGYLSKVVLSLVLVAVMSGIAIPSTVRAQTIEDLQVQIASLLQQIVLLQSQLDTFLPVNNTSVEKCTFSRDLTIGISGTDVICLQDYLTGTNHFNFSGGSTGYFGPITRTAVSEWQLDNAVYPTVGYFGPISQAKYNTLIQAVVEVPVVEEPVIVPESTDLIISAGEQPTETLAPQNAARLPFTVMNLTAGSEDIVVNTVIVELAGLASKSVFSSIVLMDEDGILIGNAKTLNSQDRVIFNTPFTVLANTSRSITVGANMSSELSTQAGLLPSLNIIDVDASSDISGVLPIIGATHIINSTFAIGEAIVTEGVDNPSTTEEEAIGSLNIVFSSIDIENTSSDEDIVVNNIRFYNIGTVSTSDLENVVVRVNGTDYSIEVSDNSRYFSASFGTGIIIKEGTDENFQLRGDIAYDSNAAGRTIEFNINKEVDINIVGKNYNYGILPNTDDVVSGIITITAGELQSFSVNNEVSAGTVIAGQSNQTLAGFKITIEGEGVHIDDMVFNVVASSSITHVRLIDDSGSTLEGPVNVSNGTVTFADVDLSVGTTKLYITGKISNDFETGDEIIVSTNPADWGSIHGIITNNTIDKSTLSPATAHTQTVAVNGLLTVTEDSSSPKGTLVNDNTEVVLGVFRFAADDVEDITLDELVLIATGTPDVITSYELFDSTGNSIFFTSEEDSATTTLSLSNVVIPQDGKVKLTVKAFITKINGTTVKNGSTVKVVLDSYKATGVVSEKVIDGTPENIESSSHTIYEVYPTVVWKLGGGEDFIPQGKMYVDTLVFSSNGNEEMTIGTITLKFIGATSTLGMVTFEEDRNKIGDSSKIDENGYVTVNADLTGDEVKINIFVNTLGADGAFQIVLEDKEESISFSVDGVDFEEGDNILANGSIFSRSYSKK